MVTSGTDKFDPLYTLTFELYDGAVYSWRSLLDASAVKQSHKASRSFTNYFSADGFIMVKHFDNWVAGQLALLRQGGDKKQS